MKRVGIISLLVIGLIMGSVFSLLGTAAGSRWLILSLTHSLPLSLSIDQVHGTLLGDLRLNGINYQNPTQKLSVNSLTLSWQPVQLLSRRVVKISALDINAIDLELAQAEPPVDEKPIKLEIKPFLPLSIIIGQLRVTDLAVHQNGQLHKLQSLVLKAVLDPGQVDITSLDIAAEPIAVSSHGTLVLSQDLPVTLTAVWQIKPSTGELWQGQAKVKGDLKKLLLSSDLSGPVNVQLQGQVDDVANNAHVDVSGDWQHLQWPWVGAEAVFKSNAGHFKLAGGLSAYVLMLNAQINPPYLNNAELILDAKGGIDHIQLNKLALNSPDGKFLLTGQVAWPDAVMFDVSANAENFNPAVFNAELPGKITFDSQCKGSWAGSALQLELAINQLQGQLRGTAVSAQGHLQLAKQIVNVQDLEIASGINKIIANGSLGEQQGQLNVDLNLARLDTLWPGLKGKLTGMAKLQGSLQNPAVNFQAQGKNLAFASYSSQQLAINLDYHPEPQLQSSLMFSSSAIKNAGKTLLSSLTLNAEGTALAHRLNLSADSVYGEFSSNLAGRYDKGLWQGNLASLSLANPDIGAWQLDKKLPIEIRQKDVGVDVNLADFCLSQNGAKICSAGYYKANGDFQVNLNARHLPTQLLQPFLPEQMLLNGSINLAADVYQKRGTLNGNYHLDMPEPAQIKLPSEIKTELAIRLTELAGEINAGKINSRFNLALPANDQISGTLAFDTKTPQTLSGHINAAIANFALLNAFVPQLTELKGKFNADLNLAGTLKQPLLEGSLALTQAGAKYPELGLEFREVNLQATSPGIGTEAIKIFASAKSGKGSVRLDGVLDLQTSTQWPLMLSLIGDNFEVSKLPEAEVAVSPDLKLAFSQSQGLVTGKLNIPKAKIQLKQLPANAVAVSPDEHILGTVKPAEKSFAAEGINVSVAIALGQQVSFSGQGLETQLSGNLKLKQAEGKTDLQGNVDMAKATYKSYGQDLSVRKGRLIFNGPIDNPWLDVEAIRLSKNKKITAVLSLSGSIQQPQTRIFSEPALPETEALAYLITGQGLDQLGKSDGNAVASAALAYGSGQAAWLADKLGVDILEVEEGETLQKSLLSIGQNLSKDFYVGAKVGLFTKQAVLVVKHKLTDIFNVETQAGSSQRVKINAEFDTD
ncbi:MAG: translocation/assembly module TamB domain-containing protein [Methylococcaceae bacterium]|jgi:translocation and assembly module TamB